MHLRRGEVWWVQLDPSRGSEINKTRPCVIVSSDKANVRRRTVMVVPLSTAPKAYPPFTVEVHCVGKKVSAIVDQMRAVSKERIVQKMDDLEPADMTAIETAIRMILEV
jgi:mRNA interferase MazF